MAKVDIFKMVMKKDLKKVEVYLESGGDINIQDVDGNTPLIMAAKNNDEDMVELLCQYDADTSVKNKKFYDALSTAVLEGGFKAAGKLVSKRASLREYYLGNDGSNILEIVANAYREYKSSLKTDWIDADYLLDELFINGVTCDDDFESRLNPFGTAMELNDHGLAEKCLKNGLKIDLFDFRIWQRLEPLGGFEKMVELILDYTKNSKDEIEAMLKTHEEIQKHYSHNDLKAVMKAISSDKVKNRKRLVNFAVMQAILWDEEDVTEEIIKKYKYAKNLKSPDGKNLIYLAALVRNHDGMVATLIKNGVNINEKDNGKKTVFDHAKSSHFKDIFNRLKEVFKKSKKTKK